MSFCAVCRNKSAKRCHRDLLQDKIGEPPIILGELLMKITTDTDYQIPSTRVCKMCTRKIGRYYKSIQEAEQIQREILELIQNQKDCENCDTTPQEDASKNEDKVELEEIETKVKVELSEVENVFIEEEAPMDVISKSSTNEKYPTEIDVSREARSKRKCSSPDKTQILGETPINISSKKENIIEHENPIEILKKSRGRPKKQLKDYTPTIQVQEKKNVKKCSTGKKENTEQDLSDQKDKKSVDCSTTEATYIYHSSQMGPPIGIHCKTCDQLFKNPKTFHAHKRYKGFTGYICETCGVQCITKLGIQEHTKMHNPDKEFKCDKCGAEFHKRLTFQRHMAVHKGETPYECEVCSKRFLYQAALCTHRIIHDERTRRFHCKLCEKKFRSVAHLRRHMAIHTGAKPFSCPICGNRFSQAYNMKAHMKLHKQAQSNKETESRFLHCQKCFEKFPGLLEYQEHTKICS